MPEPTPVEQTPPPAPSPEFIHNLGTNQAVQARFLCEAKHGDRVFDPTARDFKLTPPEAAQAVADFQPNFKDLTKASLAEAAEKYTGKPVAHAYQEWSQNFQTTIAADAKKATLVRNLLNLPPEHQLTSADIDQVYASFRHQHGANHEQLMANYFDRLTAVCPTSVDFEAQQADIVWISQMLYGDKVMGAVVTENADIANQKQTPDGSTALEKMLYADQPETAVINNPSESAAMLLREYARLRRTQSPIVAELPAQPAEPPADPPVEPLSAKPPTPLTETQPGADHSQPEETQPQNAQQAEATPTPAKGSQPTAEARIPAATEPTAEQDHNQETRAALAELATEPTPAPVVSPVAPTEQEIREGLDEVQDPAVIISQSVNLPLYKHLKMRLNPRLVINAIKHQAEVLSTKHEQFANQLVKSGDELPGWLPIVPALLKSTGYQHLAYRALFLTDPDSGRLLPLNERVAKIGDYALKTFSNAAFSAVDLISLVSVAKIGPLVKTGEAAIIAGRVDRVKTTLVALTGGQAEAVMVDLIPELLKGSGYLCKTEAAAKTVASFARVAETLLKSPFIRKQIVAGLQKNSHWQEVKDQMRENLAEDPDQKAKDAVLDLVAKVRGGPVTNNPTSQTV